MQRLAFKSQSGHLLSKTETTKKGAKGNYYPLRPAFIFIVSDPKSISKLTEACFTPTGWRRLVQSLSRFNDPATNLHCVFIQRTQPTHDLTTILIGQSSKCWIFYLFRKLIWIE